MLFALLCEDRPDAGTTRADTRDAHLAYLRAPGARMRFAGPFLDDEDRATGSLVVVEAQDRAGAQRIADADPYALAGLFRAVEIRRWRWSVNAPEGA